MGLRMCCNNRFVRETIAEAKASVAGCCSTRLFAMTQSCTWPFWKSKFVQINPDSLAAEHAKEEKRTCFANPSWISRLGIRLTFYQFVEQKQLALDQHLKCSASAMKWQRFRVWTTHIAWALCRPVLCKNWVPCWRIRKGSWCKLMQMAWSRKCLNTTTFFCKRNATQRNATQFPSESKLRSTRDMGNYYSQTSTFQAQLYKGFFMTPCRIICRLKPWWVENFMRKRFYLIIPPFRWATNSPARFYTIIHLPPLARMPFTRSRCPGIHCRCNFRSKTTSSNQQSLSPWSDRIFAVHFPIFCSFFASMHANHCPPQVPIQQLNVAYGFSPLLISEVDSKPKDKSNGFCKRVC